MRRVVGWCHAGATCRRARPVSSVRAIISIRRMSSSTSKPEHNHDTRCWKCGNSQECCHLFCDKCGKIQAVGNTCCNYFELLDMPVSFKVDEKYLEHKFKEKQKVTHPDKFSSASDMEKNASIVSSSTLNQAYQALKCPVDRARYLLALHGISALGEDADGSYDDPALMMEMFELRERIEDIEQVAASTSADSGQLEGTQHTAQALMDDLRLISEQTCDDIERFFQSKDLPRSTRSAIKLQYVTKAMDELSKAIDRMVEAQETAAKQPADTTK